MKTVKKPSIQAVKVTKNHGDNQQSALADISFSLNACESLVVTGKSGSGKSTLLHLLAGLDTPSDGSINVLGSNLSTMSDQGRTSLRAKSFGFVFQQFFLEEHKTALQNVALPLQIQKRPVSKRQEKAIEALEFVGLGKIKDRRAATLSGGQKQRVAIARAVVSEPKILFADEPTGNLDSQSSRQVVSLLKKLARKNTVVVLVTHDSSVSRQFKNHLHLKDGQIDKIRGGGVYR